MHTVLFKIIELRDNYQTSQYTYTEYRKAFREILSKYNIPTNNTTNAQIYSYLTGETATCKVCSQKTRFSSFTKGFRKYCSKKCKTASFLIESLNYNSTNKEILDIVYMLLDKSVSFDNIIELLNNRTNKDIPSKVISINELSQFLYDYPKCIECNSLLNVVGKRRSFYLTCSKECKNMSISKRQTGLGNSALNMSSESKEKWKTKLSNSTRDNIKNGKFTPCVTNSWAKSRFTVKVIQKGCEKLINCRSSWDAYFQLKNPNCLYEHIRIPYLIDSITKIYLVDFVDIENKIIYEIKPEKLENTKTNKLKFEAALTWANEKGYEFRIISEYWFNENYSIDLLKGQYEEVRLRRLLKQFTQ